MRRSLLKQAKGLRQQKLPPTEVRVYRDKAR